MRIANLTALGLAGLVTGVLTGLALAEAPADVERPPIDRPPLAPGLPNPPITRTGAEIEAAARALLDEAQVCTEDVGCEILMMDRLVGPQNCMAAFQCGVAVASDLDLASFLEAAAPLVVEKLASGECAVAGCIPPAELVAACVEARCELRPRHQGPSPDSGSP